MTPKTSVHNTAPQSSLALLQNQQQDQRPLTVYLYYRILLSFILCSLSWMDFKTPIFLGEVSPKLYIYTSTAYAALCFISWLVTHFYKIPARLFANCNILIDIISLSLLMLACGGKNNSFSVLLILTVISSGLLTKGRMPLFFAAIATLVSLSISFYFAWFYKQDDYNLLYAAALGITFFGTSIISRYISRQIQSSEILALQAEQELKELQELNDHILQRMRTGIIVTDHLFHIKTINKSAELFFNLPQEYSVGSIHIHPACQAYAENWKSNQSIPPLVIQLNHESPELIIHLTEVALNDQKGILFFIEDNTRLTHQAQQIKLASLGRLTASIAHEIRNPLSSVSHAAQLLSESQDLQPGDIKLTQIIHENCIRVNLIIENVQNLSKRQRAAIQLFELNAWLEHFIQEYLQYKPDAAIKTQFTTSNILVPFDPPQLTQVVNNLVENGIRYSAQQTGKKQVTFITGITQQERPYLEIQDQGKGIMKEHLQQLFEPFFTTEHKGTGLGLYLSREISQANHAQLDYIASKKNEGACFRITFAHHKRQILQ